jgi:hypothetical protein
MSMSPWIPCSLFVDLLRIDDFQPPPTAATATLETSARVRLCGRLIEPAESHQLEGDRSGPIRADQQISRLEHPIHTHSPGSKKLESSSYDHAALEHGPACSWDRPAPSASSNQDIRKGNHGRRDIRCFVGSVSLLFRFTAFSHGCLVPSCQTSTYNLLYHSVIHLRFQKPVGHDRSQPSIPSMVHFTAPKRYHAHNYPRSCLVHHFPNLHVSPSPLTCTLVN